MWLRLIARDILDVLRLCGAALIASAFAFAITERAIAEVTLDDLVACAKNASNPDQIVGFIDYIDDKPPELVKGFMEVASSSDSVQLRTVCALTLSKLDDSDLIRNVFTKLADDPVQAVRETAWLTIDSKHLGKSQLAAGLSVDNPIVRAAAVLRTSEDELLSNCLLDPSPFVRAICIRRIGLVKKGFAADDKLVERALAIGCVDYSQVVRSNAIITSRGLMKSPDVLSEVILLDDRAMLSLEDVLGPDKECEAARQRLGIHRDYYPTIALLLQKQLNCTIAIVPPRQYEEVVFPLKEEVLIGSAAASLLIQLPDNDELEFVIESVIAAAPSNDQLRIQLATVLKAHSIKARATAR